MEVNVDQKLSCYHCGSECEDTLWQDDKCFCCYGCKTVFEILQSNNLCQYYDLDKQAGVPMRDYHADTFAYLDEPSVVKKLLSFESPTFAKIRLYIPAIHCVSCIWLLENLRKLNAGVLKSEVNFSGKMLEVDYNPAQIKLSDLARLLAGIGYSPRINLEPEGTRKHNPTDRSLIIKLAVAGFCFGNVMLFSFPEYLGLDLSDNLLRKTFSALNIVLSIPVLVYSSAGYFQAAFRAWKDREINIDVPIAVGLAALFLRSSWDILSGFGPGYLDSFTGLVFFLLVGRWFQGKTYESLAFDRDFKSYFPLAVTKLVKDQEIPILIYELNPGDIIRIRNQEIIPADSWLLDSEAFIDYSFVTGESKPSHLKKGELIYAGGRLVGHPVDLLIEKPTSQSQLTALWNHTSFKKGTEGDYRKVIDRAARRFTWVIMGVAFLTGWFWYVYNPSQVWLVLTSVLMVACPCALALAAPFTYGNVLRVFGRREFYLKNADVIERIQTIDTLVFDKTGTITYGENPVIGIHGDFHPTMLARIRRLASCSTHPISLLLVKGLEKSVREAISDFREIPGKGIEGRFQDGLLQMGSATFVGVDHQNDLNGSRVYVSWNQDVLGYLTVVSGIRPGLGQLAMRLNGFKLYLLSGDNEADANRMKELFAEKIEMKFNLSPQEKLDFIWNLQQQGRKVMMLGDGLNDSGALQQSDVGIAVSENTGIFTPACDGILKGARLGELDLFLRFARKSTGLLKMAFGISFFYNAIALSFACAGLLTPLVAAILMPISSISVVSFATLAVNRVANQLKPS